MEVSGKFAVSSEQDSNLYCFPCDRDGLKEPAFGYCQDCDEHLCESCYKHHRKPKPTMNHVLLDKDRMPQQLKTGNVKNDQITDCCTKHSDKPLEFYCNTHDSNACYVCVTLEHKHCKVDYIPDVSGNLSGELEKMIDRMETLMQKCKSNVRIAETATSNIEHMYTAVVEDIQVFRNEINECLDKMEAEIMRDAKSIALTAKSKQENVLTGSLHIAEEMSSTMSVLKSLSDENKQNKLFIEMKHVEPQVAKLSDKEKQLAEDMKTDAEIIFLQNEKTLNKLKSSNILGTISTYRRPCAESAVYVQYEREIQVQSPSDESRSNISGMVLISTTNMIVADNDNNKIKIINIDEGTLVSEMILSTSPQDVIKLPQNKFAVALLAEKYIQIVSYTDTSLSLDRRIDVGESCYCVAYCQDKLVVGCNCNPGKLVILDLDGNMIQVFDTPGLFKGPEKIVISSDEKFIYVSDFYYQHSRVVKVDWQGKCVQRFEDQEYKYPEGIQELDDGTLLVCCRSSSNIVRLLSSFKKCEIVGIEKTDILIIQWLYITMIELINCTLVVHLKKIYILVI
ncbi:E3 ubiquitin-protein ligase TRIM71-like [Ruditapes philippinarum]|uniref:E3 ubiquitin-protein ligase TRIM71-like n=1 Tax=Ruditapes philippinarum TaxID=129788 RepID=UPI00295AB293|nr:E3 ubiquitin-protein ligase TRIM71-like [Ruditapes philippinarum]XP_060574101.1 E3 ubiquitin-protein ligase TRIM71-like [Ruditapes philippinarum]XP_060574102.1 E3 ubiquitin-protein ligase TRIM71-like [Ruditapes philippinarum]